MKKVFIVAPSGARFAKAFVSYSGKSHTLVVPTIAKHIYFNSENVLYYKDIGHLKKILWQNKPNLCVFSSTKIDLSFTPRRCKKVFIAPGFYSCSKMYRRSLFRARKRFKVFDYIILASEREYNLFKDLRISTPVLVKSLPQFDLLSNEYLERCKNNVLKNISFKPSKIVLFAGERYSRSEKVDRVRDNYDTLIKLSKLSIIKNWLIVIKPKSNNMMEFLQANYPNSYVEKLFNSISSRNIWMLPYDDLFYPYFFADIIVDNGASSVAVESCIAGRPFISISSGKQTFEEMDAHQTLSNCCGVYVNDVSELGKQIERTIGRSSIFSEYQKKFLNNIGLKIEKSSSSKIINLLNEMCA